MLSIITAIEKLKSKKPNLVIGYTSGVFDLTHQGHADYLKACKQRCDVLVLGVDSDTLVKNAKGVYRPIQTAKDRIQAIAGKADYCFEKEHPSFHYTKHLQPDYYFISKEREIPSEKIAKITLTKNFKNIIYIERNQKFSTTKIINLLNAAAHQRANQSTKPQ